jgi:hypothetical protein
VTPLGHKDICWLDVTVDYAFRVRSIQSVGHVNRNGQEPFQLHRTPSNRVLQRLSVQKFHGDKGFAMSLADFVDGADVWVIECRSCLGLGDHR